MTRHNSRDLRLLYETTAAQDALKRRIRVDAPARGWDTGAVFRLGLHAVRHLVVWHNHKLAGAAGEVGRLGAVGTATTCRAREKFAVLGLENALGTSQEAGCLMSHLIYVNIFLHTAMNLFGQSIQFLAKGPVVHENHYTLLDFQLLTGFFGRDGPRVLLALLGRLDAHNLT